jgi:GT2 family glycosyltransferase
VTRLKENHTVSEEAAPRLSVIVPVFNGRLQLPRCLEALSRSAFEDFEVIVVDDCSTDNTRDIVERWGARYLRTPRQIGPGGARNFGVRHARGLVMVFIDADVVVPPQALSLISDDFGLDADLAAVFGSYDDAPAWNDFLSQYKNLMHHYVHQTANERAVTFWAGCGAVRRDVFIEFGGFDHEKYSKPSIEDIEFGFRLSRAGRRILLEKRLQVKHLKKWTPSVLWRADVFGRAVPWTELILESRSLPADLNLGWGARISALLVVALVCGFILLPYSLAGAIPFLAPWNLVAALAAIAIVLLTLNAPVYAWFYNRRGLVFTAGTVIAHWIYYFYCFAVFVLLSVRHVLRGRARAVSDSGTAA